MGFGYVGFRLRCTWPHNSLIIYQKLQGTVAFSLGKANIQDRSNEKLHVRVTTVKYGRKTRKKKPRSLHQQVWSRKISDFQVIVLIRQTDPWTRDISNEIPHSKTCHYLLSYTTPELARIWCFHPHHFKQRSTRKTLYNLQYRLDISIYSLMTAP